MPSRGRLLTWTHPIRAAGLVLAAGLTVAASTPLRAVIDPPTRFDPAIRADDVQAQVRYLASEELAGRGSGTPGGRKAAAFIAEQFRTAGLQPRGAGSSYLQPFSFTAGVSLGKQNRLTLTSSGRGAPKPVTLTVRQEFMPLAFARNGTVTAPMVFVGYGISAPRIQYDDYAGVDVRGKIVVALRQSPDGDDPKSKFGPFAPLRSKATTAREKGAVGILFVTGPLTEAREDLGVFRLDASFTDSGIGAAIVRRTPIEALLQAAGRSLRDAQLKIAHGSSQSFPIPGARATLATEVVRERRQAANVIGFLPGSDPARRDEVVVIGAHYDHLGHGGEGSLARTRAPKIHYGADDNASGTSGLLELAAHFAAQPSRPARSLLFIAFSGEEMGLLGSAHFVKNPTVPLNRIVAMINLDMIGRLRNDTLTVIGTGTSSAWEEILKSANAPLGFKLQQNASGFGASDQTSFYARDIPVLFFFTGVHREYHTPEDTWDKVNTEGVARVANLVAGVIQRIADAGERPKFVRADGPQPRMSSSFSVYLGTIPDYSATVEGVALTGVREGSPAEKAGLKAGDIIVRFGQRAVTDVYDYTYALRDARAGVPIELTVRRGAETRVISITPARRPG
jgi:aminopeptidase YwaD